jgi:hypothetical protein
MLSPRGDELSGGEEAPEPPVTTNDTNLRRSFLTWYLMPVNFTDLRRDLKSDSRQCWWSFPINPQLSTCSDCPAHWPLGNELEMAFQLAYTLLRARACCGSLAMRTLCQWSLLGSMLAAFSRICAHQSRLADNVTFDCGVEHVAS